MFSVFIPSLVIFCRLNADWMSVIFIAEIHLYIFVIFMLFLLETFMHASLKGTMYIYMSVSLKVIVFLGVLKRIILLHSLTVNQQNFKDFKLLFNFLFLKIFPCSIQHQVLCVLWNFFIKSMFF